MSEPTVDQSVRAQASSAHSRVNIPLDLGNWKGIPEDQQADLLWFHQHILDENMGWEQVAHLLPKNDGKGHYDQNTIYKVLKGIHEASYNNIVEAIRSYRDMFEKKACIKHAKFVENSTAKTVFAAFDYALTNNCMQLVIGCSGMGKTTIQQEWAKRNNGGRSVYVDCPPCGGNKGFLRAIAKKIGVSQNLPTPDMLASVVKGFSPSRILLIDNMHRVVPSDPRSKAVGFDILQYIFDNSGCAIGITATVRLDAILQSSSYIYDQFEGRIGKPIYLTNKMSDDEFIPIVAQFIPTPSKEIIDVLRPIANGPGRLRQLCGYLEMASRIAKKTKTALSEKHILMAIKARNSFAKHVQQ